jgi:Kef-type K+ transport system membrane component KefB
VPSLLLIFSKISLSQIFAGGFLLSARFSLIIAMAEIGVELELLSKNLEQQIILLAVLTATVSPLLFRIFNKYSKV